MAPSKSRKKSIFHSYVGNGLRAVPLLFCNQGVILNEVKNPYFSFTGITDCDGFALQ